MKVSVIIPTYNGAETLDRAIISVLNQKGFGELFSMEILICDDCSTDNTLELVKNSSFRIFVNEKHTGGANKGRNTGIKNATGDVIAFLDQDDEWLPDKLINQLKEINNGADFVYSSYIEKKV